ncbi:MAG: XRE family transcriptional regulator, partial [Nitrososphaerales archaeon]
MIYSPDQITHKMFVSRVIERLKAIGMTVPALATKLEKSESTLKNMIYKGSEPTRDVLIQLAKALQTTVEYLVTGSEQDDDSGSLSLVVQTPENLAFIQGKIEVEPARPFKAGALKSIPIPPRMFSNFSVDTADVRAVVINTDAMKGQFNLGDTALVDVSQQVLNEGVYIIAIRNSVIIRRVSPVATGFALLASNPNISGTTVKVNESGDLQGGEIKIVGRIFCMMTIT